MERVQLVDRPGSFFVVCRVLNQVRLLDSNDKEFVVPATAVKIVTKLKAPKSERPAPAKQGRESFSQYTEFIDHLVKYREHVHLYFFGWGRARTKIQDKYLELTGEELPEEFVFHEPESSWEAPKVTIVFPQLPNGVKTPSLMKVKQTHSGATEHFIRNLQFAWHLIEHYDFRVTRNYLMREGKRCPVTS